MEEIEQIARRNVERDAIELDRSDTLEHFANRGEAARSDLENLGKINLLDMLYSIRMDQGCVTINNYRLAQVKARTVPTAELNQGIRLIMSLIEYLANHAGAQFRHYKVSGGYLRDSFSNRVFSLTITGFLYTSYKNFYTNFPLLLLCFHELSLKYKELAKVHGGKFELPFSVDVAKKQIGGVSYRIVADEEFTLFSKLLEYVAIDLKYLISIYTFINQR